PRSEVDYEAKAVKLAGRRYIPGSKSPGTCRNLDQMKKDAADRATVVAALERQLKKGDKSLVGNKGYRRFLANPQGDGFFIDRAKVEQDAKFDGVFVLQTNAHLSALEAMLVYKQLWTVDIDQSWRLSRFCCWGGVSACDPWRDSAPRRRGGSDRFQGGDRVGIGRHELGALGAVASVAARQSALLDPGVEGRLRYPDFLGEFANRPFVRPALDLERTSAILDRFCA